MVAENLQPTLEDAHPPRKYTALWLVLLGILVLCLVAGGIFWWRQRTTTPLPSVPEPIVDTDQDHLDDQREAALGTNPQKADTDEDGLLDAQELELGSDPKNAQSLQPGVSDSVTVNSGLQKIIFGQ